MKKFVVGTFIMFFWVVLFFAGSIVSASEADVLIGKAKNIYLVAFDKNVTIGKAFDTYKYFTKTSWGAFRDNKGRRFVEFLGSTKFEPEKLIKLNFNEEIKDIKAVDVAAQFIVNNDDTVELVFFGLKVLFKDGKEGSGPFLVSDPVSILQKIYRDQDIEYDVGLNSLAIIPDGTKLPWNK